MKKIFIIYFMSMSVLLIIVSYAGYSLKKYIDDFEFSKYLSEKKEENIDKIKEKEKELIRKGLEGAQESIEEKVNEEVIKRGSSEDLISDNIDKSIIQEPMPNNN
jgi:hypothetical protein